MTRDVRNLVGTVTDDNTSQLVHQDQNSPRANSDEISLSTDSGDGTPGYSTRPTGVNGLFQSASKLLFDSQSKLTKQILHRACPGVNITAKTLSYE